MSACPTCAAEVSPTKTPPSFPFCSPRCKLLDLDNWLVGRYVVAETLPFSEESDLRAPAERGEHFEQGEE